MRSLLTTPFLRLVASVADSALFCLLFFFPPSSPLPSSLFPLPSLSLSSLPSLQVPPPKPLASTPSTAPSCGNPLDPRTRRFSPSASSPGCSSRRLLSSWGRCSCTCNRRSRTGVCPRGIKRWRVLHLPLPLVSVFTPLPMLTNLLPPSFRLPCRPSPPSSSSTSPRPSRTAVWAAGSSRTGCSFSPAPFRSSLNSGSSTSP